MGRDPLLALVDKKGSKDESFAQIDAALRQFRVELCYLAVIGLSLLGLRIAVHGWAAAGALLYLVLMILLWSRRTRSWILLGLERSRVRRRWDTAVKHCGLPHVIPMSKIERVEGGHRARVRVGRGVSFIDLEKRREELAACLRIRELKIKRDLHNASTGTVALVRNDPLSGRAGATWPRAERMPQMPHVPRPPRHRGDDGPNGGGGGGNGGGPPSPGPPPLLPAGDASLWHAIPVGMDEDGTIVTIELPERNLLLGGVPGSGKSAASSMLLATAALDPTVKIFLIDGKMVEFAEWEDCAEGVGHTLDNAIYVLTRLQALMLQRYQQLRELGLRKVDRDSGIPLVILFVDELALFMSSGDAKKSKEFTVLITDLVARGRAAGIIVVAATQKPEGSVISTNLRDLFAYRWALACGTPQASDTILGQGWASRGFNAATIPIGEAGTGYLLAEDGMPARLRTFYLTDNNIRALAVHAREVRRA